MKNNGKRIPAKDGNWPSPTKSASKLVNKGSEGAIQSLWILFLGRVVNAMIIGKGCWFARRLGKFYNYYHSR